MSFKGAELNYPVHEKEMLAIIRALKKWRVDLVSSEFTVYTDHRTLENFDTQKDLSCHQARWMKFMSQYDCKILYIKGEDNCVADTLSCTDFDGEPTGTEPWSCNPTAIAAITIPASSPFHAAKSLAYTQIKTTEPVPTTIASVLRVTSDTKILDQIRNGYNTDPWCAKLLSTSKGCIGLEFHEPERLWYIGDHLIIPCSGTLRETLFQLVHDSLGHFGFNKSYKSLHNAYYWPNMCSDLEKAYIPGCHDCQQNKSRMKPKVGPLYPLPIPDQQGDSVAIDFIRPLPKDQGHDCIITFTDRCQQRPLGRLNSE
jgi:hypothetical protein